MDIRDYTKAYTDKSDAMGALSFLASLAVYFAALTLGALYASSLWISLPMVVILAFASVRLLPALQQIFHGAASIRATTDGASSV